MDLTRLAVERSGQRLALETGPDFFISSRLAGKSWPSLPEFPVPTPRRHQTVAITVISILTPAGRAATWTVVRPGGVTLKYSPYTLFISSNSLRSVMWTVTATASSRVAPASARMALMFSSA